MQSFWQTQTGYRVAFIVVVFVAALCSFYQLSEIGIWEPWEANEIAVAQDYAKRGDSPAGTDAAPAKFGWNDMVPTKSGRPVNRPWLKSVFLAKRLEGLETSVGDIELAVRLPFAVTSFFCALVIFGWGRRRFGTLPGMISACCFASLPALYIGSHNVSSETFALALISIALLAAFLALSEKGAIRYSIAVPATLALCLVVLELRLGGLYFVLSVLALWAASERAQDDTPIGLLDLFAGLIAIGGIVATLVWAAARTPEVSSTMFAPFTLQWVGVILPICLMVAALLVGRKSGVVKSLISPVGLLLIVPPIVTLIIFAVTYGDANPVLFRDGEIVGKIPVLAYLLENEVFERSLMRSHVTFEVWIRQLGFSTLPWCALLPGAYAYASQRSKRSDNDGASFRFLIVWLVASFVFVGAFSAFGHYTFFGYAPLALCIGAFLTDTEYWATIRKRPLLAYATGFFAVAIILMLGKDLERFPVRFIELFLTMQEDFKLPEDFTFGRLYKPLKYVWMLSLSVFFFGLVSWAILTVRNLKNFKATWKWWTKDPHDMPEYESRAAEKRALLEEDSIWGKTAAYFESPESFAPVLTGVFVVSAILFLGVFIPNTTDHLSQRGVFETFTRSNKTDVPLYRYQVSSRENSVYLEDTKQIANARDFESKFKGDERFFATIPRSKLAAINGDIRKKHKRNVHVLDARSSRLLLVSNQLNDGEKDQNFIADLIVDGEPDIMYPLALGKDKKKPIFDGQLEMLGWSADRKPGADGLSKYAWGETAVITYYFKVLKKVPSNQKIFLHVDYPGSRINGDHYPNDGDFPTNQWIPGDIVKSVHHLEIESYSSPGDYTMWFGFFVGSKRMAITPKSTQDGKNRVNLGKIKVSSVL